jgi:GH24 family phage-related lysozyme (muramidase)
VRSGETISHEKAEEYLKAHVEKRCRPALMKIPTWNQMNENQQAALYSFAYNLGEGFYRGENFKSITSVCDSPELWGDRKWIADQFVKYRNPGTNVEEGLRNRRLEEAELFCRPVVNNSHGKMVETGHVSSPNSSAMSGKSTTTIIRTNAPTLQQLIARKQHFTPDEIARDRVLATEVQKLLIPLDLLDAPADGKFGPISTNALFEFQSVMLSKIPELDPEKGALGPQTAESLLKASLTDFQPALHLGNDLASRIIKYMKAKNYYIFTGEQRYNIVYVEGMNSDGTLNDDLPNHFNDARMVIECKAGEPKIVKSWDGTSEPGDYYTFTPISPYAAAHGVARIKFGQYKAWCVGTHGTNQPHEALVQCGTIEVHRDYNRNKRRDSEDEIDRGDDFAINQHCGYDNPPDNIGKASAGCLVGRTCQGHEEFMRLIKQDKRYRLNQNYMFYTTIIPGNEL